MRRMLMASLITGACLSAVCLAQDLPTVRTGALTAAANVEPIKSTTSEGEVVTCGPANAVDITVYGSAFAQIQETRTAKLHAGRNKILLTGVAAGYRTGSFQRPLVKGPGSFEYRGANYQTSNLTNDRLLQESIGKNVTAWRHTAKGLTEITGELKTVNGAVLVLGMADGKTELVNTADVTLLKTPTGLSNTSALVVEADVTAGGDYTLDINYETSGITWSAQHTLILDEENSKLVSWDASVLLVNESGTAYKNATLRLQNAKAAAGAEDGGRGLYAASVQSRNADASEAGIEKVGDQNVYTIPVTVDLAVGQTRQLPLFEGKQVPVKRQYIVGTQPRGYYGNGDGKFDAQIRLTVENCDKHNLGKPIPSGLVKVYQYNSAKKLQLTGSTRVGEKAADEIFDLNVGTSSDIKWEVTLAKSTPVAGYTEGAATPRPATGTRPLSAQGQAQPQAEEQEWEDRDYEVTVYNYKRDKSVTVKVEVNVPAKQQLNPKWLRPRADRAETELNVPKSDKASVQYTIRTRVR